MSNKAKTKKVFTEIIESKSTDKEAINNLLKRFKSHEAYNSIKKNVKKPNLTKNEANPIGTTPNQNNNTSNINNSANPMKTSTSKGLISNSKGQKFIRSKTSTSDFVKKDIKITDELHAKKKLGTIKTTTHNILGEESIQELECEDNSKIYF